LGTVSFLAAIVAPLMIGSVFGLTESRVTYFGPVMSIYCLLMAVLSGTALCLFYNLVIAAIHESVMPAAKKAVCDDFTRIFTFSLGTVVIFTLVKIAIEANTVVPDFLNYRKYAQAFGGIGHFNTEVILGLFVPFILMVVPFMRSVNASRIVASGLTLAGTLAMHMEILLAGQSRPVGPKAEQYPDYIHYFPSGYEWMVFLLAVTIILLLYTLGERFLKLEAVPES
jgi:molybdopterin-containing oxidoreductase family membrane subunit